MYFEDLYVGQTFVSGERTITESALEAFADVSGDRSAMHTDPEYAAGTQFGQRLVHGPLGLSMIFGFMHELQVFGNIVALLDAHWSFPAPIFVGDSLHFEMTIVRCRRTSAGDRGYVNRDVRLINQDGVVVQAGTTACLIEARSSDASSDPVGRDFCTIPWGRALAELLSNDPEFSSATASFDGTVGLESGETQVQLRIYRGKIIEVTRRTPQGATFVISGTERAWIDLALSERDDYVVRTIGNEFHTTGNGFEYLRLTKAVQLIWSSVKKLAAGEQK
ncbi:MaoC/PaaZ C-terminal domain-containing protein [Rhodococcoides yunnanense]|uniref:MaoC/PaaZ C-terminal domain-containing protein n=1 Tax=Rhodococcoides yunnanense TaxID=278209 RepID=UPI000933AD31|nr:MaoC/PaaZ C-terminal domain-containing protein [Rhodococcus yunnanensis]